MAKTGFLSFAAAVRRSRTADRAVGADGTLLVSYHSEDRALVAERLQAADGRELAFRAYDAG